MNTMLGSFKVPPASLPVFPVLFIMILAPLYNHVIVPFARKITKTEMGITHLQRIGIGLFLSIVAMAVAALVETKRKKTASKFGSADLFTLAGMMEFFFTEAPWSMRSLATALSWTSLAMGYFLSTVLVSVINKVTGAFGQTPWLL
ncbi:nitrate transporter, partial [Trifolium pratense]